ncbi:unnamed protein product [Plutella xylostella]|uniref:(diamondback moth) hypothetical protein n=1 Tax=Plutella xylostella TaxID=51655 RepID=A0A8S4DD68_PLUXY|nr:unnamed protein product [Plutella xylostella]
MSVYYSQVSVGAAAAAAARGDQTDERRPPRLPDAAMAVRAPLLPAALLLLIHATLVNSVLSEPCTLDGLHADYDTECREYYRCAGGVRTARYACPAGRAFSPAEGACVPRGRQPCVRRRCAAGDQRAYAAPGTACRHYYRCHNGSSEERACPPGAWFDLERQACSRGAGTCFEPLCAGLPDGDYPDASHECRRRLRCRGGELRAVLSCGGEPCAARCPAPRSAAAPLPVGDATSCADAACASLCEAVADGAHADHSTGCREYFVCAAGRVVQRGVCEAGMLFAAGGCRAAARASCPAPARSPCHGLADGRHRDWRDCASWFECRRERVAARGACPGGQVFADGGCADAARVPCEPPRAAAECAMRPSGLYQHLESNCSRYFHCAGGRRTLLGCGVGRVFDGARCVAAGSYVCPSQERDSCWRRADGRYRAADAGCRGYYACAAGDKALFACAPGQVFTGEQCAAAPAPAPAACRERDQACAGLADGYHPEFQSNCRRYFYCEGGDHLATLSCNGGRIFDGRSCVEPALHRCGAPPRGALEGAGGACPADGFYLQPGTDCRSYYFCLEGVKTYLTCPDDQAFNGQVCVPRRSYTCPG